MSDLARLKVIAQTLILGVLIAACGSQKGPAQTAINQIDSALKAAGADAQHYAATRVAEVNQGLAKLRTSFDANDYQAVVDGAPPVLAKARTLGDAVASGKALEADALDRRWKALAAEVPKSLDTVERQLSTLERRKSRPHGVTSRELSRFATSFNGAKAAWEKASAEHAAGHLKDALENANQAETKTAEMGKALGVRPDAMHS